MRAWLVVAVLILASGTPAYAERFLVIESGGLGLYEKAAQGAVAAFRSDQGEEVSVLSLGNTLVVKWESPSESGEEFALTWGDAIPPVPATPDAIIAVGQAASLYAEAHFPQVDTVHVMVMRTDRLKLGPKAVGVSMFASVEDMLATLRLVSPNIRQLGVLHGPGYRELVQRAQEAVGEFDARIIAVEISDERDLPRLARNLVLQSDAVWVMPGTLANMDAYPFLLKLSFEHRVPLVTVSPALVRAGALLGVTADPHDLGRQAARLAGYLARGEELPPERLFDPDFSNFSINLKTARAMGIEVPRLLVDFASFTVE